MTTPVDRNSGATSSQTRTQDATQKWPDVASETQQRFRRLLKQPHTKEEEMASSLTSAQPPLVLFSGLNGFNRGEADREGVSGLSGASASGDIRAEIDLALHALTEAICASTSSNPNTTASESVSLCVNVLSGGPLTGAQMFVAAEQGKLQMVIRAANDDQRKALESIRSTLSGKIRSLERFEIQLGPENHSRA